MARHKTQMPWGKYQGVRVRHLPDDYLSWLYDMMVSKAKDEEWNKAWAWLKEAVQWEMRRRGFKTPDLEIELAQKRERLMPQHKRKLCLE
jgi:hypothetical protein